MKKLDKSKAKSLTKSDFLDAFDDTKRRGDSFEEQIERLSHIDSLIITDESLYTDLMSLCKFNAQKWRLIYRASRDGFRAKDFHNKCDDTANTLTIIKTTNSSVFGGYASSAWSSFDEYKEDEYAFLFSLVNARKNPLRIECSNKERAIHCLADYGPCFGKHAIVIEHAANLSTKSSSCLGREYGQTLFKQKSSEAQKFLAGAEHFQPVEIEVFVKDYKYIKQVG